MATTLKEVTVLIEQQQQEITRLQSRVSTLVDELHTQKNELNSFKTKVATDMQTVSKNVRANMVPGGLQAIADPLISGGVASRLDLQAIMKSMCGG